MVLMQQDVSSFVERYQLIYERDPDSKVFAPLAEAYRRMGLVDEAIDLAKKGVQRHPNFASGRVALGKCYVQRGLFQEAVDELKNAVNLSPENLLAHQLLADCYTKLGKPGDALNSYKMVLFLNPNEKKVADLVKNLETKLFASTTDKIAEDFKMERIEVVAKEAETSQAIEDLSIAQPERNFALERELALFDSRVQRGELNQAMEQIKKLARDHPTHREVQKRRDELEDLSKQTYQPPEWISPLKESATKEKVHKLYNLLERVESRQRQLLS